MMKQKEIISRRLNNLEFLKESHEIVKYAPQYYDENGVYQKDEWTCFSDVGKEFEGKIITMEDYLDVEDRFISVTRAILEAAGCTFVTLGYVEPMRKKGLKEGMRVRIQMIDHYIRLVLRGEAWIVFINSRKGVQFDFSEDVLYMHLNCHIPEEPLREIVENRGLYLDPRAKRIVISGDDSVDIYTFQKNQ